MPVHGTHQRGRNKLQDSKDSGQTLTNGICCLHLLLPSVVSPFLCSLNYDVWGHYPLKSPVTHWAPSFTAFLQTPHVPKLPVQVIMNVVPFLLLLSDHVSFLSCQVPLCPLTSEGSLDTRLCPLPQNQLLKLLFCKSLQEHLGFLFELVLASK